MTRPQIENLIEALIAMLDNADGDCDLEADDNGVGDADGLLEQDTTAAPRWLYAA